MIGLVERLNSKINFMLSEKDCMKLLNELTHDLFTKHRNEIDKILLGFPKTEQSLSNIVTDLFLKRYVDEGFNGSPTNISISLDNLLRTNLTEHFQVMQYLSSIYKYSRKNSTCGR